MVQNSITDWAWYNIKL